MDKLIAWLKSTKWVLIAILGVIVTIVLGVLRGVMNAGGGVLPPIATDNTVRVAADKAHEEALIAHVKANTTAEIHTVALQEIAKVDDGAERRAKLAALLKTV